MSALPAEFLATALLAVDRARFITGQYFRTKLDVDSKQDQSPVTIADRETEQEMIAILQAHHPDHGVFGEESGDRTDSQEWRWIIDPIDGTKSFATGKPTFGTLLSLLRGETPVLGIIDHPILDERWIGIKGEETTFNGVACQTRSIKKLEDATVYTTTLDMFNDDTFKQYTALSRACKFRAFGGDCYSYGLLASGHNDLVCEADLKPYDYLALVPVVQGAGGIISDWQGKALGLDSGDQVLASANLTLHQNALEILCA